jgi:hypothetical protein
MLFSSLEKCLKLLASYQVVYGIEVLPTGDPYIETAERAMTAAAAAVSHGTFFVDIFPICVFSSCA